MEQERIARKIWESTPEGKNKTGRPRKKWEDQIHSAAEKRVIKLR